jgi:UDP-N-acetylmuramate dehydrogenase
MNWWKELKGRVKRGEPLKKHTTFKIGGPARLFIEPKDIDDLRSLVILLKQRRMSASVIGAGSNLLVSDRGVASAVIRLSSPRFRALAFRGRHVEVGAGSPLPAVIEACAKKGLSGLEFLAGIPGTMGGALAMNAGQTREGLNIGNFIETVTVMDLNGRVKRLTRKEAGFGYRTSRLSRYIILDCRLKLAKKNKSQIRKTTARYIAYRRASQDYGGASAGCVFRNPEGDFAGRLIDECGLKGRETGGARVSSKHANFIINKGRAKAKDVLALIRIIQRTVKKRYAIELMPEIKIWR